jgi:FkbM family methyltransferase
MLEFYGFDPIREAIEALRKESRPGRVYFELALGNEDSERKFFVGNNTFSSSFFGTSPAEELNARPEIERGTRMVKVSRLDRLFENGVVKQADYIKLDCEGFEPEILTGAREYLRASGPICVSSESSFGVSPTYPRGHFHAINEILAEHRLAVVDVNMVRSARASYRSALAQRPWAGPDPKHDIPHLDVGAPGTLDAVFCRDFVAEDVESDRYRFHGVPPGPPSIDRLIKAMINFELHGLMDCAYDVGVHFRDRLTHRIDVNQALELLLKRAPHARNTADVVNCLAMIAELRLKLHAAERTGEAASHVPPDKQVGGLVERDLRPRRYIKQKLSALFRKRG